MGEWGRRRVKEPGSRGGREEGVIYNTGGRGEGEQKYTPLGRGGRMKCFHYVIFTK